MDKLTLEELLWLNNRLGYYLACAFKEHTANYRDEKIKIDSILNKLIPITKYPKGEDQ